MVQVSISDVLQPAEKPVRAGAEPQTAEYIAALAPLAISRI